MKNCLLLCKDVFEALEVLEKNMGSDGLVHQLHQALLWAQQGWCREVLVALAECNFLSVPEWVTASCTAYSRRWGSTKLCEEAINANRDQEDSHRKGSVGRVRR